MSLFARLKFEWAAYRFARLRAKRFQQYGVPAPHRGGMVFGSRRSQSGWTLIELMIVVAIIGIAAALSLPAYANFTSRAAASEGIQLADAYESSVSDTYMSSGQAPGNDGEAGVSTQKGKYVATIDVKGAGQIVVTYGLAAPATFNGQTLVFTPYLTSDGSTLAWVCGYATPLAGWTALPADAAGTGNAAPATTIGAQYLPKACRAGG
jgi:type IV pilus assembly protein PilA